MAYTQQDLAAIDAAILTLSTGGRVSDIKFSDRSIKYQDISLTDLQQLRSAIARQLNGQHAPFMGRSWTCRVDKGL